MDVHVIVILLCLIRGFAAQETVATVTTTPATTSKEQVLTSTGTKASNPTEPTIPPNTTAQQVTVTKAPAEKQPTTTNGTTKPPATVPPVTTKTGTSTSTVGETTEPTEKGPDQQPSATHGFDAGSFIGGIVLCAAVVAIIYFGCKAFRSKKPDYSTL